MKEKKKLNLDALRVKSFVTSSELKAEEQEKINGRDGSPVWMCPPITITIPKDQ